MTSQESSLEEVGSWVSKRLPDLLAAHDVPAASLAISLGGEVFETAAGVLNLATGVKATTDSVFQIGSITKVWTATLVMQLVDEGLVDLDAKVRDYVPELTLADEDAAAAMTVRQLLCHTAGFEGDIFTDTGRGDDCVEKLIATLGDVSQLFTPGELFSYNNVGYCLLGRLVEKLRGKSYNDCLADQLFVPLGLTHAAASPYEAISFRVAMGHVTRNEGEKGNEGKGQEPAPSWAMARSNGPAGSQLSMTARDLLTFAQLHLDGGTAADGTRVLEPASVQAMQNRQVTLPDLRVMGNAWGLGWELFDTGRELMIGHDGNTIGQASFLRVVPGRNLAVALLTNGGAPYEVFHELVGHVLAELADLELPALPTPPAHPATVDPSRYVGTYLSRVVKIVVSQDEQGRIWSDMRPREESPDPDAAGQRSELVSFAPDVLIPVESMQGLHIPHAFVGEGPHGAARWLHVGRALPRENQPSEA